MNKIGNKNHTEQSILHVVIHTTQPWPTVGLSLWIGGCCVWTSLYSIVINRGWVAQDRHWQQRCINMPTITRSVGYSIASCYYNNNNNNNNVQIINCELGRRITQSTDDHRESAFLFQWLSVLIQRYNAVAVLSTFTHTTPEDEM